MTDSNPTRRRAAVNKQAMDDVLGDPYSKQDDKEGHYNRLKHRSILSATKSSFGESKVTLHPAKPNAVEFCLDVELIIQKVIGDDPELLAEVIKTYITGTEDDIQNSNITQQERVYLEQRLGKAFLVHGISPVVKYFAVIKRRNDHT